MLLLGVLGACACSLGGAASIGTYEWEHTLLAGSVTGGWGVPEAAAALQAGSGQSGSCPDLVRMPAPTDRRFSRLCPP